MYPDGSGPASPVSDTYPIGKTTIERDDALLVECVRELGDDANGEFADLRVNPVPEPLGYRVLSKSPYGLGGELLLLGDRGRISP